MASTTRTVEIEFPPEEVESILRNHIAQRLKEYGLDGMTHDRSILNGHGELTFEAKLVYPDDDFMGYSTPNPEFKSVKFKVTKC